MSTNGSSPGAASLVTARGFAAGELENLCLAWCQVYPRAWKDFYRRATHTANKRKVRRDEGGAL